MRKGFFHKIVHLDDARSFILDIFLNKKEVMYLLDDLVQDCSLNNMLQ